MILDVGAKLKSKMATPIQTVGSENAESLTPDGVIVSEGSPSPNPDPDPSSEVAVTAEVEDDENDPLAEDRKVLRRMGLSNRVIRKLLGGGRPGSFLSTRVTSSVALVFVANSLDELQRSQRKTNEIGADTAYDVRARVAALSVSAQCGMAIARAAEVAVKTAAAIDNPEKETEPNKVVSPVTNNFFLPPVAKKRPDAQSPVAKLGAEEQLQSDKPSKSA